ncbi:predicted protein [Clavispora lusitaniae ATCC 42720]|uniref:Uncharacterized protein n=1 Tax=Clavispora lusitaniae (strain ATCC 42720) TaxID=306902 RepID=C4XZ02_CLAL4|nr:uncharacterized protein CLUG_01175 [Clavispora lusitaniae ATCC 42720]EEQ37052.1 predicted protein [Clavispora lusitaniae ATCC 42720]
MDPSTVVLRYNREKWDARSRSGSVSPTKFVTLTYQRSEGTPSRPQTPFLEPPKHFDGRTDISSPALSPSPAVSMPGSPVFFPRPKEVSAVSEHRPVSQSLRALKEYKAYSSEKAWYIDLVNVAQRLRLLRDTFKVIQSVRKKRMMGERADFRSAQENASRSPMFSDDEHTHAKTEDDENMGPPIQVPPPNRRGRPRKKGTRGRKPAVRVPVEPRVRTRRALGSSPLKGEDAPTDLSALLTHPPILPSQRHFVVEGFVQTPSETLSEANEMARARQNAPANSIEERRNENAGFQGGVDAGFNINAQGESKSSANDSLNTSFAESSNITSDATKNIPERGHEKKLIESGRSDNVIAEPKFSTSDLQSSWNVVTPKEYVQSDVGQDSDSDTHFDEELYGDYISTFPVKSYAGGP